MVQPTQHNFTFIWSAPNMVSRIKLLASNEQIPLRPRDAQKIWRTVEHLPFQQASSSWPNRFVREDAKRILQESLTAHLAACGWREKGDELVLDDSADRTASLRRQGKTWLPR